MPTPVVRQYTVFNAEQADGLPARPTPTAEPLWKVHQHTEKVWEDSGVPVRHVAGDRAFYNLNRDEIVLPERGQFPSANHYYQTALHELGHSTGHPERMNRDTLTQGMNDGFGSPADAQKISDFVLARSRERQAEREPTPVAVAATRTAAPQHTVRPERPLPVPARSFGPRR